MDIRFKRALVLAPHTDDGELACGATIHKMIKMGIDVYYVAFSSCRESLPSGMAEDTLVVELKEATSMLGIPQENVRILDFQVRYFEQNRQAILDAMIDIDRDINPDVVFSPSVHDIHQDHLTIANECLRAFKKKTIFHYEVPWNNYSFDNQLFMCVDEDDVLKKIKAVACYKSQINRSYVTEDFIRGLLMTHGVQIGTQYAEVFEIPHIVVNGFNANIGM